MMSYAIAHNTCIAVEHKTDLPGLANPFSHIMEFFCQPSRKLRALNQPYSRARVFLCAGPIVVDGSIRCTQPVTKIR